MGIEERAYLIETQATPQEGYVMRYYFCFVVSSFVCFCPAIAGSALQSNQEGFSLVDRICVEVEGEPPILLSDIHKRSSQKNISFTEAKKELTRETVLWVVARTKLKFDVHQINKAADDHLKKVMDNLKISLEKFADLLKESPYLTTPKRFQHEVATSILKEHYTGTVLKQITVGDVEVFEQVAKIKAGLTDQFDVVFLRVAPTHGLEDPKQQLKEARAIQTRIKNRISLETLKNAYKNRENISINGPQAYEKGTLKNSYEEHLSLAKNSDVTEPFKDGADLIVLWKIKSIPKVFDETALEKVRKELYEKAVMEKYQSVTDEMMNSSAVVDKNCTDR